jgi:hypothetical protein
MAGSRFETITRELSPTRTDVARALDEAFTGVHAALDAAALNDVHQKNDDCDDQQHVDKATHRVRGDETQNPKCDQHNCKGPQLGATPSQMKLTLRTLGCFFPASMFLAGFN